MKLTIQHLQHAWNSQAPDWDKRLQKFTKTMIEQIDTLSIIASEFSSFAKISHDKKRRYQPLGSHPIIYKSF